MCPNVQLHVKEEMMKYRSAIHSVNKFQSTSVPLHSLIVDENCCRRGANAAQTHKAKRKLWKLVHNLEAMTAVEFARCSTVTKQKCNCGLYVIAGIFGITARVK